MAGNNLELIDYVKGNDNSHGFTLKNYIKYLLKKSSEDSTSQLLRTYHKLKDLFFEF